LKRSHGESWERKKRKGIGQVRMTWTVLDKRGKVGHRDAGRQSERETSLFKKTTDSGKISRETDLSQMGGEKKKVKGPNQGTT